MQIGYICPKLAVLFKQLFDLRRNKGFSLAESPFCSLSQQKKRTVKKNRFFGTCKPAKYGRLSELISNLYTLYKVEKFSGKSFRF